MRTTILQFAVLILLHINYVKCEAPLVKYKYGTVRGKYQTTFSGRKIAAFLGVPYASPPVGENRFEVKSQSLIDHLTSYITLQSNFKSAQVNADVLRLIFLSHPKMQKDLKGN